MVWSVSASRTWSRCQRQLFFDVLMASAVAKDEKRRRAQILGNMQNLAWWPGRVVHDTLERMVLPKIRFGQWPEAPHVVAYALELAERQFQFSEKALYRRVSKADAGDNFLMLAQHYYGEPVSDDALDKVLTNVSTALNSLLQSEGLMRFLLGRTWYNWEQGLHFSVDGTTVRAVPDLVVPAKAGLGLEIVDWKVAATGGSYHFQVGVYALAARENEKLGPYARRSVKSYVVNLLSPDPAAALDTPLVATDEDLAITTDTIFESIESIRAVTHDEKYEDLDLGRFEYAQKVGTCAMCNWRELCVEMGDDSPAKSLSGNQSGPTQLALPLG